MKRILIMLLLCLPTVAFADASIEFVNETHDFGCVTQGEILEFTFEFSNRGTEELVITKLQST